MIDFKKLGEMTEGVTRAKRTTLEPPQVSEDAYKERLGRELIFASIQGDVRGISRALKEGANVNFQDDLGWTGLMHALSRRNFEAVSRLLHEKPNIDLLNEEKKSAVDMASDMRYKLDRKGLEQIKR